MLLVMTWPIITQALSSHSEALITGKPTNANLFAQTHTRTMTLVQASNIHSSECAKRNKNKIDRI